VGSEKAKNGVRPYILQASDNGCYVKLTVIKITCIFKSNLNNYAGIWIMSTITFDTLKFVERLEKAGVPREQASAMAEAFKDASGEAEVVTRKDIALAVAEIKTEIANVRGEMALVKWMLGAVLAIAIANFAKQFF
jgi:hypothetical protein